MTMVAARPTVGPEIGNQAPDFTLEASDGRTITLSEYRGRRHVILWFTRGLV